LQRTRERTSSQLERGHLGHQIISAVTCFNEIKHLNLSQSLDTTLPLTWEIVEFRSFGSHAPCDEVKRDQNVILYSDYFPPFVDMIKVYDITSQ